MKANKYNGFTLAELITAVVIIALLLGVLVPALSQVKKYALEAKQKAQISSIEVGINMYKNDFGEYPPSHGENQPAEGGSPLYNYTYCGAQTLAEAMFGQDLLGFSTVVDYNNEGTDNSLPDTYPEKHYICDGMSLADRDLCLQNRKDPYLDRTNIGVFTPEQIFNDSTIYSAGHIVSDRYVICDVFTAVSRHINGKQYKIGTPVLYFQANLSPLNPELKIPTSAMIQYEDNIYNYLDNMYFLDIGKITDKNTQHPLYTSTGDVFCDYIQDKMIPVIDTTTYGTPMRKDTYLLISAGFDGLYGTKDDICNFTPNVQ